MFRVPPLVFKEGSWTTVLELSQNVTGLQALGQIPKVKASESAVTSENTLSIHTGGKRCLSSESFTSQPLRAVLLPHSSQRCSTLSLTRSCCRRKELKAFESISSSRAWALVDSERSSTLSLSLPSMSTVIIPTVPYKLHSDGQGLDPPSGLQAQTLHPKPLRQSSIRNSLAGGRNGVLCSRCTQICSGLSPSSSRTCLALLWIVVVLFSHCFLASEIFIWRVSKAS